MFLKTFVALKRFLGLLLVFALANYAIGQENGQQTAGPSTSGLATQHIMSLSMAKTIAEAALETCRAKGYHTSVVVVDHAGQVMVMLRDEQASAQTLEMARRKAFTARMFRSTTLEFQRRTALDSSIAAQRDVFDILALGGGAPIMIDRETIGAVGSSGSSIEQDDACAKAGVAKAMDLMKVKLF